MKTFNLMTRMKGTVLSTLSLLCSRTDEEAMCRVKMHDDHREFARLMILRSRIEAHMVGADDREARSW